MAIKKMTHANGTQTPDEIIVDYAINDGQGNQIDTTYAKLSDIPADQIFPVNVTLTSTSAGTSDKTRNQIYEAILAGMIPVVFTEYSGSKMTAFLSLVGSSYANFCFTQYGQYLEAALMSINNNGAVSITWKKLAPTASPALTGTPTAPTASTNDDSTQIATTAFVKEQIGNKITFTEASDNTITCDTTFSSIYNLMTSGHAPSLLPIYFQPYSENGVAKLISTSCKLLDFSLAANMEIYFLTMDSIIIITYDSDNIISKTVTPFTSPINSATGVSF